MKRNHSIVIALFFIFALTVLTYYPSLWYGFTFDDLATIKNNHALKILTFRELFFSHARWVSVTFNLATFKWFGINLFGYRVINLGMALGMGSLVFIIVRKLLKFQSYDSFARDQANVIALLTAGLFLLHPVQTQTATYVTQMRLEGLALLFILCVLWTFIQGALATSMTQRYAWFGLSLAFTAFSAGTKEIIIVLPFLVLLVDWFFIAQGSWEHFKKRILLHGLYFIILFTVFFSFNQYFSPKQIVTFSASIANNRGNTLNQAFDAPITALPYFFTQIGVLIHYLFIFIWPFNLCFDYEWMVVTSPWNVQTLASFFFLAMLGLTAFYRAIFLHKFAQGSLVSFSILWFFICNLPRASIIPSAELVCDYKTYLGSFGMMLLLAYFMVCLLWFLYPRLLEKPLFLVLIFIPFAYATYYRNLTWSAPLNFWGDVIKKSPRKARAHNNYAAALCDKSDFDTAFKHFTLASELDQNYAEPLINMAIQLQAQDKKQEAKELFLKAVTYTHEPHIELYINLGVLFLEEKNYKGAQACFETAVAINHHEMKPRFFLAKTYVESDQYALAIPLFENLIEEGHYNAEIFGLCGIALHETQQCSKAQKFLEIAVKSVPMTQWLFVLGICYYQCGNYAQAEHPFELVYATEPKNNAIAYNLAQTRLNLGLCDKALPLFEQCLGDHRYPFAVEHTRFCKMQLQHKNKA